VYDDGVLAWSNEKGELFGVENPCIVSLRFVSRSALTDCAKTDPILHDSLPNLYVPERFVEVVWWMRKSEGERCEKTL
jgi:hypothetical protein